MTPEGQEIEIQYERDVPVTVLLNGHQVRVSAISYSVDGNSSEREVTMRVPVHKFTVVEKEPRE